MAELVTWCSSRLAILKWLQVLCTLITVLFLVDGRAQWGVYTFVFISSIVLGILSFVTLLIYFLRIHTQSNLPWISMEIAFNAVATILSGVFGAILIYDYAKMSGGQFNHHRYTPPQNIGVDGWKNRVVILIIAQITACILYFLSLYRTKRNGLK